MMMMSPFGKPSLIHLASGKVFIGLHALSSPGQHCSVAADALFGHHANAIRCSAKLKSGARKENCSFGWLMELRRLL
ncbi:hypothetical protein ACOMHN_030272 [Nucella lapillus]